MKAVCRPLERTRGKVVADCVENLLNTPSAGWKARVKEIIQAARQDERQQMLKKFVRERKTWDNVRSKDKSTILRLQNDIKQKDRNISWLRATLNEREDYISKLKRNMAELEKHLEIEMVRNVIILS